MGIVDSIKGQFLDVIEYEDTSNRIIVYKYARDTGDNELKQGSKVIVREGQQAVFVKGGQIADILFPGTYELKTENFPVLSSLAAFPFLFTSPVISDVYYISTKQSIGNKWATKSPILKRDSQFNMVRIRAFGQFSFRIIDVATFMREVFGSKGIVLTYEVIEYLSGIVVESFASYIGESAKAVLDLASEYRSYSDAVKNIANDSAGKIGIVFDELIIESISLPDEVEKLIDEQTGIGMAKDDMQSFMQYQSARAMRDAAQQPGGLAGVGAGVALGNQMMQNINTNAKSNMEQLRELKQLLDEGILTQEEFEAEKKKILG